ncbi:hypothetical protein A3C96_00270 [Candidatus Uhrbacteria bacterium RIFCSPHIGHO2_02_FULL_60_10]|uniref:Outer membrane protein beta-barrel domain-containing protein n=1 Tax=Candidatus Uhrbacteria bacterium RIFCSPHIGHO2_02_FULL_60_10 TaxID=1802392 RepID=A0A1F7U6Y2_9BACT|nr:MAG: hypothetical protein A3C96_00270 [Candidatus Uhrbacteria bacterium RIFCSPHIGHO2_02_FULL_60_10]
MRLWAYCAVVSLALPGWAAAGVESRMSSTYVKPVGGFIPAAIVRPQGDTPVRNLPAAESVVEVDLGLKLAPLEIDTRPFMVTTSGHAGPSVVGLHYDIMLAPFACAMKPELSFDRPWAHPCLALGYAHRSEHNTDDGTYGSTYTNALAVRARLLTADRGRTAVWLRGELVVDGLETPFVLTSKTDALSGELEKRLWLVGANGTVAVKDIGKFAFDLETRASSRGVAAAELKVRYRYDFAFSVLTGGTKESDSSEEEKPAVIGVFVGVEGRLGYNFRQTDRLGRSAAVFSLIFGLPLGG